MLIKKYIIYFVYLCEIIDQHFKIIYYFDEYIYIYILFFKIINEIIIEDLHAPC